MQIVCLRRKIRHFRKFLLLRPPKAIFFITKANKFSCLVELQRYCYDWISLNYGAMKWRRASLRYSNCSHSTSLLMEQYLLKRYKFISKENRLIFFLFVVKGSVFLNGRNYFLMKIKWHEKSWQLLKISHYLVEKKNVFQKGQNQ